MSDKPKILAGLVLFLGLATFPIWYTLGSASSGSGSALPPDLDAPTGAPLMFSTAWSAVCDDSDENVDQKKLEGAFKKNDTAWPGEAKLTADPAGGKWRVVHEKTPYLVVRNEETVDVYDGRCVESREWMVARHMDLLIDWRNQVVREGGSTHASVCFEGQEHMMSLTGTCMKCHESRQGFCAKCHEYADVSPVRPLHYAAEGNGRIRCWDCHVAPDTVEAPQPEGD